MFPPLTGVEVKVTDWPEQMVVDGEGKMLTLGVTDGLIVIVVLEEDTSAGLAQFELEVILQ